MRSRFLVTYDVADPKRLRQVFKVMKGFGTWLQLSVFSCDLTEMTLVMMKAELAKVINAAEDGVLIVDVGPSDGRGMTSFECLGRATLPPEKGPRIV
ncbi:MAG: CRISPR-associated endonuclease Cas2 [Myxococcaceae bacterium]|jgi:CRISPR-associated protein Cas2|nr:CRISPR-associated endonuclease Cas2 [Myxococcaceae bacterium]